MRPRTPWSIGDKTYGTDTVIGISLAAFLAGDRGFTILFEPDARRALKSSFWCGGRLVISILDDLAPVFEAWTPAHDAWSRDRVAGLPGLGTVHVWSFDREPDELNGDLLASAHDPLTPPSLFIVAPAARACSVAAGAARLRREGPCCDAARSGVE